MKVLLVLDDLRGNGGTERTVVLAARELRRRGIAVHVLHGGSSGSDVLAVDGEISEPSLFTFSVRPPLLAIRAAVARVRDHIERHAIDVVHVHGFPRVGLRNDLAAGRPVVVTAHNVLCPNGSRYQWGTGHACNRDIGLACLVTGYRTLGCGHLGDGTPISLPGFGLQMVLDSRFRRATREASAVIAPSRWMKSHLEADGADPARTVVVSPPIVVGPDGAVPSAPSGTDLPVVAFVGRLVQIKGADVLLRASARARIPHRLLIAGDGGARCELEFLARELGIAHRTEFLGAVSPQEADALRRRSQVVAVSSVVPETFGMVGPEALLAGVPVVAQDFAGTSDWIAAAGGMVRGVPLRDEAAFAAAIDDLLLNPPSAEVRVGTEQRFRELYSVQRHVEGVLSVYCDVLRTTPGAPDAQQHVPSQPADVIRQDGS